jgi:hypothetical protein
MKQVSIYLCHKCLGHLSQDAGPSAYACSCMSGYVRDWQVPTPADKVREVQLAECEARNDLYAVQKRSMKDTAVVYNNAMIVRLVRDAYHAGTMPQREAIARLRQAGLRGVALGAALAPSCKGDAS